MSWKLGIEGYENVIPAPVGFKVEPRQITREGRTVSGKLVKDIIAVKKNFVLIYNPLTADQVQTLLTEYERQVFLSFIYPDRGQDRQATVWFSNLPREKLLTPVEYWGNFSIVLEEQ